MDCPQTKFPVVSVPTAAHLTARSVASIGDFCKGRARPQDLRSPWKPGAIDVAARHARLRDVEADPRHDYLRARAGAEHHGRRRWSSQMEDAT